MPLLTIEKGSKTINISSIAGLSECLYHEYKSLGLHVVSVAPGPFKTNIYSSNAKFATNFNNKDSRFFDQNRSFKHI